MSCPTKLYRVIYRRRNIQGQPPRSNEYLIREDKYEIIDIDDHTDIEPKGVDYDSDGLFWFRRDKVHQTETAVYHKVCANMDCFYENGMLHRTEVDDHGYTLPACFDDREKFYCVNDVLHNADRDEDGFVLPAHVCWSNWEEGRICLKEYYINGLRHRADVDPNTGYLLPAYLNTLVREDGSEFMLSASYWLNGVKVNRTTSPYAKVKSAANRRD